MSIFARLNYDSGAVAGFVQPLSTAAIKQMNAMPQLMNTWQQSDVANGVTTGYFQNPVGATISNIIVMASNIIGIAESSNVNSIAEIANTLAVATGPSFLAHTNRLSGVEPINTDTVSLPHYTSAIAAGKMIQYITFQSDGVQNNGPILGNFTSLFTGNTLNTMYTMIQTDANNINANMSLSMTNSVSANINSIITLMTTRQNYDNTFFTTSQSILNDFNSVKPFSQMGQTESQLTSALVGTPKLLSRLNP